MDDFTPEQQRELIIRKFGGNPLIAHRHLFPHRHKNASPDFHEEVLNLFHSTAEFIALQAFRGGGKSTLIEEYAIIRALFRVSRYIIIIGNTHTMAVQRLFAIKSELTTNDHITSLFGDQVGGQWTEDEIVLSNGVKIQAVGARQSLRGAKMLDVRPDLAIIDDFEDEEGVATEEALFKNNQWLYKVLLPALDISSRKIRMLGTPLSPKALMETLMNNSAWQSKRFPAYYINEEGEEVPSWPDRFPMEKIKEIRDNYTQAGNITAFMQEYMCRAEDTKNKPFQPAMVRVEPAPKLWLPTELMVDPARTVGNKSARTGYAVWSWNGPQLIVHEAFGAFHKPDEIIKTIFKLDSQFEPAAVGVEVDGLEEFLMQPLRTAMVERGVALPLEPQRAPKNKEAFITSLQPFYTAKEVIHVKDLPDLVSELLQFPIGRIDVPNALAYALRMRPGRPVYEDFGAAHISTELDIRDNKPVWLALSSRPATTVGLLVQYDNGIVTVFIDWVRYGPPQEQISYIVNEASQVTGMAQIPRCIAPQEQFDKYSNHGLPVAAKALHLTIKQGGSVLRSEGSLTPWLTKRIQGQVAFRVDDKCRWLINGLSRGYARKLTKSGTLEAQPTENQYKVLVEALEAYMAVFNITQESSDTENQRRYAVTPNGRRYVSSLPTR